MVATAQLQPNKSGAFCTQSHDLSLTPNEGPRRDDGIDLQSVAEGGMSAFLFVISEGVTSWHNMSADESSASAQHMAPGQPKLQTEPGAKVRGLSQHPLPASGSMLQRYS